MASLPKMTAFEKVINDADEKDLESLLAETNSSIEMFPSNPALLKTVKVDLKDKPPLEDIEDEEVILPEPIVTKILENEVGSNEALVPKVKKEIVYIALDSETYTGTCVPNESPEIELGNGISRSDIVQKMVDVVFDRYSLRSCNVDFFGQLVANTVPEGYYVQKVGAHDFFIKETLAVSLSFIISLMDKARAQLKDCETAVLPLLYKRNLEGAVMRALFITEREMKEIKQSYPDFNFGYADQDGVIDEIKIVVTAGR